MTPYLKALIAKSSLPLKAIEEDFAVDSSGFSTSNRTRWFDVKYGNNEDWHDWIKMHLMTGVKTHIVTSVEISEAKQHDSPFYEPLLEQTAKIGFNLREVSADKGYISKKNLALTVAKGATPYIPFKSNVNLKMRRRPVEKALLLLQLQAGRIPCALSQAVRRGNDVSHDQGQVWRTATL